MTTMAARTMGYRVRVMDPEAHVGQLCVDEPSSAAGTMRPRHGGLPLAPTR